MTDPKVSEWKSNKYWRNRSPEERIQNARIPTRFRNKNLNEYDLSIGDEDAFNAVKKWVSTIDETLNNGMGLYLYGSTGVGKTHIAQGALKQILTKHKLSGIFITADRYMDMIYDEQRSNGTLPEAYSDPNLLKYMRRVFDIVVLDGLGSERSQTTFAHDNLTSFISNRYEEELITIVTSNLPPPELKQVYGARMLSMLQESCYFIKVEGKDHRMVFTNAG